MNIPTIGDAHRALVWCLKHGVKAVEWSETGYWAQAGYDGAPIMPPADLHVVLDAARTDVLAQGKSESTK